MPTSNLRKGPSVRVTRTNHSPYTPTTPNLQTPATINHPSKRIIFSFVSTFTLTSCFSNLRPVILALVFLTPLVPAVFGLNLQATSFFDAQEPDWIRHQQISPDAQQIAFVYKGNIYTVPATGGEAHQLTFHTAHDTHPVWSRDGSKIAFASDRFGNFDIYVMDSQGGEAKRLTFHSAGEYPSNFTQDNKSILFHATRQDHHLHRQFPSGSQPELYAVPVDGGRIEQILTTPASTGPDGKLLLYEDIKGGENPWRKKHRSSVTRDIWVYNTETGTHRQLTGFEGEDRNPVFNKTADVVFYLSERSGSFNVFKMPFSNEEEDQTDQSPEQLTYFAPHPVRFLSHAEGILSFGYHGQLYTLRPGEEPFRVPVIVRTQEAANDTEILAVNGEIEEMAISPNGKEIVFYFFFLFYYCCILLHKNIRILLKVMVSL